MFEPFTKVDWKKLLAFTAGSDQNLGEPLREDLLPKREAHRQEVLLAIAEIDHRLRGNAKCVGCNAPVRAVMRTVSVDDFGQTREFACLCRRCLEAEKAYSRKVTSYVAGVVFDETANGKELVRRPGSASGQAAA
ncbi:MAG: hypothetical protein ABIP12_07405 [Terriglobales bacterium]